MYSPALFSAVLLFTASGFSSALPADGTADGAAKADTAGSGDKGPECRKYHVKSGDTCDMVVANANKQKGISLTLDDFLAFNPTINKDCRNMLADHDYCITKPPGGKKDKGGKKSGSKPKHAKSDPAKPQNGYGDQKQEDGTGCARWYTAVPGDNCFTLAKKANIGWEDLRTWNHDLQPKNQPGRICLDVVPAQAYCVAGPTAYRAVAHYHPNCGGDVHNDVAVPPGSTIDDGVCINTECKVGSLKIPDNVPGILGCPKYNVQISYFESKDCGSVVNGVGSGGLWFGYDYASIGDCHRLQDDGWQVQSLHLRCAPQWNDCVNHQDCSVNAPSASGICHRGSILAFGQ